MREIEEEEEKMMSGRGNYVAEDEDEDMPLVRRVDPFASPITLRFISPLSCKLLLIRSEQLSSFIVLFPASHYSSSPPLPGCRTQGPQT